MAFSVRFLDESGNAVVTPIDPKVVEQLAPLPERAAGYFDLSIEHRMIPLDLLVASRARPDGIVSANGLMLKAAADLVAKRPPITVTALGDGMYLVRDGNSTFVNGLASGWAAIPCSVSEEEATRA